MNREFWLTCAVGLAAYALPEEFSSFIAGVTRYAFYGFCVGVVSYATSSFFKYSRNLTLKEVFVVWPESWTASNSKVIRFKIIELSLVSCKITREGENVPTTLTWQDQEELQVIFPAKQSGEYRISLLYNGREVRHSPWIRYVCPGPPDPDHSAVVGSWASGSSSLVLQPECYTSSALQLKDSYENVISTSRSDCDDVRIQVSKGNVHVSDVVRKLESQASEIKMSVKMSSSGAFTLSVLYKGHKLSSIQVIVCKPEEYSNITNKSTQLDLIELIGQPLSKAKAVHVYLNNAKQHITIKEYIMKVIPWTLMTHRVSPRLSLTLNPKCDELVMVNESIPNSRIVLRGSGVLALCAGYYTNLAKRMGGSCSSLEEKKDHFAKCLRDYHNNSYLQLQILGSVDHIRNQKVYLKVKRHDILDSTLKAVKYLSRPEWLKLFVIQFEGEDGVDQGGLRREWMELFSRYVLDPRNLLFTPVETEANGLQPNPYPPKSVKTEHYRMIGKLFGKCLFESCFGKTYRLNIQGQLSKSMLTQILGGDVLFTHLSSDAPKLYASKIKYILENQVEGLDLYFTQEEETSPGVFKTVDICSKGSHKAVTEENKQEYVFRLARFLLVDRVNKQVNAFLEGFHSMVPVDVLEMFDESELELMLHGIREYNVEDLKRNYVTVGLVTLNPRFARVLDWFWTALSHFSKEDMAKFVQFVTGSSVLPPGGWRDLSPKFQIGFSGETGRLPLSFTCSNYLLLPNTANYQEMEKVLLLAVREGVDRFIMGS